MKWNEVLSSSILDIRDGTHSSPKYIDMGFPLITSKNLVGGKVSFNNVNYISEGDFIEINKRSKVDKGDLLYSMIGTVGSMAQIIDEPNFAIKNVALFKFNNDVLSRTYFYYLMQSTIIDRQIKKEQKGGTQKFVSLTILRGLKIPLPPLPVQKKIAAILDAADDYRQKTKALIERYDALTQSLFLDMFGDPVKNEKGFQKLTIRDVVREVKYGTSSKASDIGAYPYLRMNNITYKGYMDFKSLKFIDIDDGDKEKYIVRKGDILFNRTNSKELVGKTGLITSNDEMIIAGYLIRVRVKDDMSPYFIWAHLNSRWAKQTLNSMCKSIVGMANINAQELQNIPTLKPPKSLQESFASKLKAIEKQKQQAEASLVKAEELFQSLLQRAFKGELTISEDQR